MMKRDESGASMRAAGLLAMGALAFVLHACGGGAGAAVASRPTTGTGGIGGETGGGAAGGGTASGGASAGGAGPLGGPCTPATCNDPPVWDPPVVPDMDTNVQAMSRVYFGDVTRTGVVSPDAWQDFGFAISGTTFTSTTSGPHCIPRDGAKPGDVILNGANGVDNSFGKNVVPILLGLAPATTQNLQDAITAGNFSVLVKIAKLGPGADHESLDAIVYSSMGTDDGMGSTVAPPATDWSSYTWHPFDTAKAGVAFHASHMVNNQWFSGLSGDLDITLSYVGFHLPLAIHQARLAHTYSDDHTRATLGNLGGVLVTEELVVAIKGFAGRLASGLCCGSAIDALLEQIRQASDIGQDGTQDPTKVCDAISIGLGYETTRSQLGDPAPPSAPLDACTGVTCP